MSDYPLQMEETLIPLNDVEPEEVRQDVRRQPDDDMIRSHATDDDAHSVGSAWAPAESYVAPPLEETIVPPLINDKNDNNNTSLPDRLVNAASGAGASALLGSLELLKIAGGFTLSTTGALVAPPLKVTQQVILPSLWEAIQDYVTSQTPARIKDWIRIVTSSIYHFITVLTNTDKGAEFRSQLVTTSANFVDCVSADASRQVVVDGMVWFVKLAESLKTPESQAWLQQCTILATRVVDAASSGPTKQLIQDVHNLLLAGIDLAADPSTIIALSEVTATLCHTLEMEQALHRRRPLGAKDAARRRYERNEFTRQVYTETQRMQDPNATPEQVILSGLGGIIDEDQYVPTSSTTGDNISSSGHYPPPPQVVDHFEDATDPGVSWEEEWRTAGRDRVDSQYLQQSIQKRAQERNKRSNTSSSTTMMTMDLMEPPASSVNASTLTGSTIRREASGSTHAKHDIEEVVVETVNEDDDDMVEPRIQRQNTMRISNLEQQQQDQQSLKFDADAAAEDMTKSSVISGPTAASASDESSSVAQQQQHIPTTSRGTAVDRFYQSLDAIMAQKREEVLTELVDKEDETYGRSWNPSAASSSLKTTAKALHRAVKDGDEASIQRRLTLTQKAIKKNALPLTIISILFLLLVLVWFGLGCYGIYVMVRGSKVGGTIAGFVGNRHGARGQEIVIRVVREVVHINQNGDVIGTAPDGSPVSVDSERIAECVNNALG